MQNAKKDTPSVPVGIRVRVERDYNNEASAIRTLLPEFWAEIMLWDSSNDTGPIKALSQRLKTVLTEEKLDKEGELGRIKRIFLFFINNLSEDPRSKDDLKEALLIMEQRQKFAPMVDELSRKISQVAAAFKISDKALSEFMGVLTSIRNTQKDYAMRFSYIRASMDFMRLHDQYVAKAEEDSLDKLEDSFKELGEDNTQKE